MNVCTKCGIQFEDGVQFCQNCGTKRRRSVVKKNMSGGAKVGITLLALFVIAIIDCICTDRRIIRRWHK